MMSESDGGRSREFEDLVPWYVNGTLDRAGRERLNQLSREIENADEVIAGDRALQRVLQATAAGSLAHEGFARVQERIGIGRVKSSWAERIGRWFGGLAVRPIAAVAASLLVIQGVTIAMLVHRHDPGAAREIYSATRSPEGQAPAAPLFTVDFKPDAKESEIRFLLIEVGAKIVDGPSQMGAYVVELPPGSGPDTVNRLKSNAIVLSIAESSQRGGLE